MIGRVIRYLRRVRHGVADAWHFRGQAIKALDARSAVAQHKICVQIRGATIRGYPEPGRVAWGQFLDSFHHQRHQWGRFGTSAAVQSLAIGHRWEGNTTALMATYPLDDLSHAVLPDSPPATVEQLEAAAKRDDPDPMKDQDFRDPLKTAFVVDALSADEEEIAGVPEMVQHLLGLSRDGTMWNTSSDRDEDRTALDKLLASAYVLYVLRRFRDVHLDRRVERSWAALASHYELHGALVGEDLGALTCLALSELNPETLARMDAGLRDKVVEVRDAIFAELQDWASGLRYPVINRPYFNCYSRDDGHDYIFLSPDLLTAVLVLRHGNPAKPRGFALRVVEGIVRNVAPPEMPADQRNDGRGFRIQRSMEGTVDQMWALRVLWAFHERYQRNPKSLRPTKFDFFGTLPMAIFFGSGALAVAWLIGGVVYGIVGVIAGAAIGAAFPRISR